MKKAIEEEQAKNKADAAEQQKKMMAQALKQKMMQAEMARVESELNEILPLVNEANLAAQELDRKIHFTPKLQQKIDPFVKKGEPQNSKTEVLIKVDNGEDKYYYEWPIDKFKNRMFIVRDILDEFFDSGEMPKLSKEEDPFWDPPNPILLGQSFM